MEIIKKTNEPQCLIDIRNKFRQPYKSIDWEKTEHGQLRIYMLKNEQNWHCAFCGEKFAIEEVVEETDLSKNSYANKREQHNNHIDHFVKRELDVSLIFTYENLFVSCNSNNHCARHKDEKLKHLKNKKEALKINKELIKPTENISDYIDYTLNGTASSKNCISLEYKNRAELTIEYFNLNCEELKQKKLSVIIPLLFTLKGIEDFDSFMIANKNLLDSLPADYRNSVLLILDSIKGNIPLLNYYITKLKQQDRTKPFGLLKKHN